ncbi:hypothetical protein [Burkholderia anthina]|uniref:hypothetical protein n=1 Tax=Burkholderia anthina TaxID=179879 RepID=UPI0015892EAC|nr:hypothetical protein [Burkholderia anthina]
MTHLLCQRRRGPDRTIRLFSGGGGRAGAIDANPLDWRARTRASCRRAPSIRQRLLWERHYDERAGATGRRAASAADARRPGGASAARRMAPQIVPCSAPNTRRFCVLGGAERRTPGFLP